MSYIMLLEAYVNGSLGQTFGFYFLFSARQRDLKLNIITKFDAGDASVHIPDRSRLLALTPNASTSPGLLTLYESHGLENTSVRTRC